MSLPVSYSKYRKRMVDREAKNPCRTILHPAGIYPHVFSLGRSSWVVGFGYRHIRRPFIPRPPVSAHRAERLRGSVRGNNDPQAHTEHAKPHLGLSAAQKSASTAILALHGAQLSAATGIFSANSASQGEGTSMGKVESAECQNRVEMSKPVTSHACYTPL